MFKSGFLQLVLSTSQCNVSKQISNSLDTFENLETIFEVFGHFYPRMTRESFIPLK
jgi:hypothetical protein